MDRRNDTTVVHSDTLQRDVRGKVVRAATAGIADVAQVTRHAYGGLGYLGASEYIRTSPGDTITQVWTLDVKDNALFLPESWYFSDGRLRVFERAYGEDT